MLLEGSNWLSREFPPRQGQLKACNSVWLDGKENNGAATDSKFPQGAISAFLTSIHFVKRCFSELSLC